MVLQASTCQFSPSLLFYPPLTSLCPSLWLSETLSIYKQTKAQTGRSELINVTTPTQTWPIIRSRPGSKGRVSGSVRGRGRCWVGGLPPVTSVKH